MDIVCAVEPVPCSAKGCAVVTDLLEDLCERVDDELGLLCGWVAYSNTGKPGAIFAPCIIVDYNELAFDSEEMIMSKVQV